MSDECQCPSCEKQRNFERPKVTLDPEFSKALLANQPTPAKGGLMDYLNTPTRGAEQVAREIAEKTFGHPVGMSSKPFYELKDSISAAIDEAVGEANRLIKLAGILIAQSNRQFMKFTMQIEGKELVSPELMDGLEQIQKYLAANTPKEEK